MQIHQYEHFTENLMLLLANLDDGGPAGFRHAHMRMSTRYEIARESLCRCILCSGEIQQAVSSKQTVKD